MRLYNQAYSNLPDRFVAGQRERAPIAVNQLHCAGYERHDLLSYYVFAFTCFLELIARFCCLIVIENFSAYQRWSPRGRPWPRGRPRAEVESRTQGSRPRPRTQKKSEAKAKDSLSEDKHSRGQGQECSRPRQGPRTQAQDSALQKKKKRASKKFFRRSPQKNVFQKIVHTQDFEKGGGGGGAETSENLRGT